jgi:hypothetical protein
VVSGALAIAACSKGRLMADAGAGAGGGEIPIGTGQAGAGGADTETGQAGAGGADAEPGTGGVPGCVEHTLCTADAGAPPSGPSDGSPCSVEGARCSGFACLDASAGGAWVSTCCLGRWWPNTDRCPVVPVPGTLFTFKTGSTCVVGESYCLIANPDRTAVSVTTCEPLCAAGDCSCFCDHPAGCDFKPPGSNCPGDTCTCSTARGVEVGPVAGAINVECKFRVRGEPSCYFDGRLAGECPPGHRALSCTGPPAQGEACTPLPDVIAGACGTEVRYYCCPS